MSLLFQLLSLKVVKAWFDFWFIRISKVKKNVADECKTILIITFQDCDWKQNKEYIN